MTTPTPRAALTQLLARLDETTGTDGPVPAWMDSYCTAVQALKAEPEGPSLQWTDNMPPSETCRYDHCIAETPFGRFLITWKSWKEYNSPTVDETPWGDWYAAFNSVDDAKAACQQGMNERLSRWGRIAAAAPVPGENLPPNYIDSEHAGQDRELLEVFYLAARAEGGTADECILRGLKAVLAARPAIPTAPPSPETPAEALAARPLLEQVARLGDVIGQQTVGQITAISNRAAAWLRDNPPGRPVAIEPRGCPTPGACSCVEPIPPAPEPGELVELLKLAGRWATSTGVHLDRFAALFDHQEAELAALREGVPVALSEWEDAFMSGVCAALATATAHGDSVIWGEIVRSVGIDNALNYAANVNPEDWELAGFSKYAQPELGKDKPLPAPQAGEGE